MASEDTQFKPGQSGNPKGRPKKLYNELMKELIETDGFEISKSEFGDMFQTMLKLKRSALEKIANDTEDQYPVAVILLARGLYKEGNSQKAQIKVFNSVMDRVIGPVQKHIAITTTNKDRIISKAALVAAGENPGGENE